MTYDSAESIATPPPESDLDDAQIREMLASPMYLQERDASADRPRVYHIVRENLMSSSSQDPKSTEKPVALFSSKTSRIKKRFPTEDFSSEHQHVPGSTEPLLRFSHPENYVTSFLEEHRDYMVAEANSEILKQDCKVDTLNPCIRELERQAHSNRLELDSVTCGYEESRREQARLHEELAQRERKHFELPASEISMKWKN